MFLYTDNEQSQKETNKISPFTTASKRIKYFGINLTKEAKDLYIKNYKALLKELKKQINGKIALVYRLEDLILLRCQYYLYQFGEAAITLTTKFIFPQFWRLEVQDQGVSRFGFS